MKTVIVLYAVALLGVVVYFAPRCQPGDTAIRVGHMLLAGCQ